MCQPANSLHNLQLMTGIKFLYVLACFGTCYEMYFIKCTG